MLAHLLGDFITEKIDILISTKVGWWWEKTHPRLCFIIALEFYIKMYRNLYKIT